MSASSPTTSSSTGARTRSNGSSSISSRGARVRSARTKDPTEGMEPEEALHFHILRRRKEGVEAWIDRTRGEDRRRTDAQRRAPASDEGGRRQVRRRRADPAVRAPVGGSHEARGRAARAVPRPHRGLHERDRRHRNRVRRRPRHRQVTGQHDPDQQRLHGRRPRQAGADLGDPRRRPEHEATAIGLSALLVSTSKQMPACVAELHERGLRYPVLVGGAAINRDFGLRILYPKGADSEELYEPGVFYCKDAFEGLARDGRARRAQTARASRRAHAKGRAGAA